MSNKIPFKINNWLSCLDAYVLCHGVSDVNFSSAEVKTQCNKGVTVLKYLGSSCVNSCKHWCQKLVTTSRKWVLIGVTSALANLESDSGNLSSNEVIRRVSLDIVGQTKCHASQEAESFWNVWLCFICSFCVIVSECMSKLNLSVKSIVRRTRAMAWGQVYSSAELRKKQLADPDVGVILKWFESGKRPFEQIVPATSPATKHYWLLWDSLLLKNGVLYRKFLKKDGTGEYGQLVVPKAIREQILFQMHTSILSGHLGRKKTQGKHSNDTIGIN